MTHDTTDFPVICHIACHIRHGEDPAQEKAVALEGYKTALAAALKAGISPDTLKALILAEGKAKAKALLKAG